MNYSNKICLVTPYDELAERAEPLLKQHQFDIDIYRTNLNQVVQDVEALEQAGYQVLISRGGCAELLRRHSSLPVVEIKVSLFDLFDALAPYAGHQGKIGVVGFNSVIASCRKICDRLNIDSECLTINDSDDSDMQQQVDALQPLLAQHHFDHIIGDSVYQDLFAHTRHEFTIIHSGDESIIKAFNDADSLIKTFETQHRESLYFQTIFDHYENSLLTINSKSEIVHINQSARAFFGDKVTKERIQQLSELTPELASAVDWSQLASGDKVLGVIVDTDWGTLIVNQIPVLADGNLFRVMLSIQTVNSVRGIEHNVRRHELARRGLATRYRFNDIISNNKDMKRRLKLIESYAKTDATIMIYGESGTGKEMIAQSIHNASLRSDGPFVAVNCGALAPQLLESELFGYVSGAFTGASAKGKMGLFELAHGGTIFLDEISELDKTLQSRLLRVLQERQIMRLGSDQVIPIDIRVISASNNQLLSLVKQNRFREDLYYRLNILKATPLPLRERPEDIMPIGKHLLSKFAQKYHKPTISLSHELWQLLLKYDWPGNVRQFSNIIERLVLSISHSPASIDEALLLLDDMELVHSDPAGQACRQCQLTTGTFAEIRVALVKQILQQEQYNKSRVAKRLDVDRTSINRWLHQQPE